MGRRKRLELTRMIVSTGLPRWRKVHGGHIYYFRGEYADALRQWHALRDNVDTIPTPEEIAVWQQYQPRQPATWEQVSKAAGLTPADEKGLDDYVMPIKATIAKVEQWRQRQQAAAPTATGEGGISIGAAVAKFLASKRLAVGQGLSASRWDTLRRALEKFSEFASADSPLAAVNEQLLSDYHAHLLLSVKRGTTPDYAATLLSAVKQWTKWAYRSALLDRMPRNLSDLVIKVPAKSVKVYSVEEVRALLAAAPPMTKLAILLALNTGMTSRDISDLHPKQVDLGAATITRKRSKTADCASVPVVCYSLWPEVVRLLRIHRADDAEHWLLNANGNPLNPCELHGDTLRRRDAVAKNFTRAQQAAGVGGTFKLLRKTSATLLAGHPEYQLITHLYLGHSPRGIQERHYTRPPQQILADGLAWLAGQFGLAAPTASGGDVGNGGRHPGRNGRHGAGHPKGRRAAAPRGRKARRDAVRMP